MNIHPVVRSVVFAWAVLAGGNAAAAAEAAPVGPADAIAAEQALSVNVNTADAEELADLLNGVGLSRAQAIVEHREAHGPFQSAQDLVEVRGIGQATLERNLPVIRVR